MREGDTGLCNQNTMTSDGLNPIFIPQPASKQGIHTGSQLSEEGGCLLWVEMYFQEVSMVKEFPASR